MASVQELRSLLEPALGEVDLVLEDVTITPAGRRRVVRVVVDVVLPEVEVSVERVHPLSLDEVAAATRVVDATLEADGLLGQQPYTLEVTSPGVSRPLTTERHFRRNIGRLVALRTTEAAVTGRIIRADHETVTLEIAATKAVPGHAQTFPYAAVDRAEVQVEFSHSDDDKED